MNPTWTSVTERYDKALSRARHTHLPPGTPVPQPTAAWPPENVALLQQYQEWLLSSGDSPEVVKVIALPMAGHVLGLTLKPHPQLDLETDLNLALDYLKAKQLSAGWIEICRGSLAKFRLFLGQQRGQPDPALPAPRSVDSTPYCTGFPDWLVAALTHYQRLRQRNWRPGHLDKQLLSFWNSHTHLWRWLFGRYPIVEVADIKRQYLFDYFDDCLAKKYAISTINKHLRCFQAVLRYLQEQDVLVPQVLLRLPGLKEPDHLPRFLTDEQVRRVRDDLEMRVEQARSPVRQRDALLDRAAFYLLWQGGLRLGEVEALRLEDVDLAGRRLTIRDGKGRKDRTVYLTDRAVAVLQDYLNRRGMGGSDHVFLYRHRSLRQDLIPARLKAAGQRVGVKVSSHRLRHTYATQLLNAGCRVTSIQKLLGHRHLNTTMIYARVHDRTVAGDYYVAMARIEKSLDLALAGPPPTNGNGRVSEEERTQLLELVNRLADPDLGYEGRLDLVEQMRLRLDHADNPIPATNSPNGDHRLRQILVV
jgi:site-specific recombinase XerD